MSKRYPYTTRTYGQSTPHQNVFRHYKSTVGAGPHPVVWACFFPGLKDSKPEKIETDGLPELGTLLAAGFDVLSPKFRDPDSSNMTNMWPTSQTDVHAFVGHVRARHDLLGINPDRIYAWGASGGGVAALLAGLAPEAYPSTGVHPGVSRNLTAIGSYFGITDLTKLPVWDPVNNDCGTVPIVAEVLGMLCGDSHSQPPIPILEAMSPVGRVTTASCPIAAWHGDSDDIVQVEQLAYLDAALTAANVDHACTVVAGGEHRWVGMSPTERQGIAEALRDWFVAH